MGPQSINFEPRCIVSFSSSSIRERSRTFLTTKLQTSKLNIIFCVTQSEAPRTIWKYNNISIP